MDLEPVKKVFTLKYCFTSNRKWHRFERTPVFMVALIGLSAALAELAYIETIFFRSFAQSYDFSAAIIPYASAVVAFLLMALIIGTASYLRISDEEESYQIMKVCGASPAQILRECVKENVVAGITGGTTGAFSCLLVFLMIYGSQLGWPPWLWSLTPEYLASGAITTMTSIGVSVLFPFLFSCISLNMKHKHRY